MWQRLLTDAGILAVLLLIVSYGTVERDAREPDGWWDADWTSAQDSGDDGRWTDALVLAVTEGDTEAGYEAEGHLVGVSYDDTMLLSLFMEAVPRPGWAPIWAEMAGEVLVNRVRSPEFPGRTIREVLFAQTDGAADIPVVQTERWAMQLPKAATVRTAVRLLRGDGVMHDPQMVHIGPVAQGSRDGYALADNTGGVTYICRTSHPELYEMLT